MAFKQGINIPMLVTTALVSILVLVVLIAGTEAWFNASMQQETDVKETMDNPSEFAVARAKQAQSLERVGWTDSSQKAVTIPIEQAMQIMVQSKGNLPTTQP